MTAASPKTDVLVERIARAFDPVAWNEKTASAMEAASLLHRVDRSLELARSCLSAIKESGMVIVPREPTREIVDAMHNYAGEIGRHWHRELYRAALAASPKHL